jgi:hypothetical protein
MITWSSISMIFVSHCFSYPNVQTLWLKSGEHRDRSQTCEASDCAQMKDPHILRVIGVRVTVGKVKAKLFRLKKGQYYLDRVK